jgi:predicted nucleic acid-binding protein
LSARFVLDASVALAWFAPEEEEERRYAQAVLDFIGSESALCVVPALFHLELGNFLVRRRRHKGPGRFGAAKLKTVLATLDDLAIETHQRLYSYSDVVTLAQRYDPLQGKDVAYFDLAQSLALPIAAIDGGIRTAARNHGLQLLIFD